MRAAVSHRPIAGRAREGIVDAAGRALCVSGARPRPSTPIVVGLVGRVFGVADALLNLPFDLLHAALDLLARVVGRIAECTLCLAGDVLQLSFGLITIHESISFGMQRPMAAFAYMKGKGMS
jgi:hypothetical protein